MHWIYARGIVMVLLCMILLSGCTSRDNTVPETMISRLEPSSQSQEIENILPGDKETAYDYVTEEHYAKRDDNNIYGVMYIPQNAGDRMPAVIFSHGFGGNYQVGTQYAEKLLDYDIYEVIQNYDKDILLIHG